MRERVGLSESACECQGINNYSQCIDSRLDRLASRKNFFVSIVFVVVAVCCPSLIDLGRLRGNLSPHSHRRRIARQYHRRCHHYHFSCDLYLASQSVTLAI